MFQGISAHSGMFFVDPFAFTMSPFFSRPVFPTFPVLPTFVPSFGLNIHITTQPNPPKSLVSRAVLEEPKEIEPTSAKKESTLRKALKVGAALATIYVVGEYVLPAVATYMKSGAATGFTSSPGTCKANYSALRTYSFPQSKASYTNVNTDSYFSQMGDVGLFTYLSNKYSHLFAAPVERVKTASKTLIQVGNDLSTGVSDAVWYTKATTATLFLAHLINIVRRV